MSGQKPRRNKKMKPFPKDEYDRHQAALPKASAAPTHKYGTVFPEPSYPPSHPSHGQVRPQVTPRPTSGRLVSAIRRHPGVATGAVVGSAVGVGALRYHRQKKLNNWANEKKAAMSKNLINPFEEVVVFGKAYPVVGVTNVRSGSPKTHTGRGVGHGQRLTDIKNSKGKGGRTKLERYKGGHASGRVGPFGKALTTNGVPNALKLIAGIPKATKAPAGLHSNVLSDRLASVAAKKGSLVPTGKAASGA